MKAKVIATGEIVEVMAVKNTKHTYIDSNGHFYPDKKLEFLKDIDWEQRRFELVKVLSVEVFNYPKESHERKLEDAIKLADAVITKLKEE